MSTYIVIDIDELVDAILETWSHNDRHRALREQEEEELARQRERLRAERERLEKLEREREEADRKAREEYTAALKAVEKKFSAGIVTEEAGYLASLEEKRDALASLAARLKEEGRNLGSVYLADISNYRTDPAAYEEIAQLQQLLAQQADLIIQDRSLLSSEDTQTAFAALETAAAQLQETFEKLTARLAQLEKEETRAQEKADRYALLLTQLADGTRQAVRELHVLPEDMRAQARDALSVQAALDIIRHYLLGPESIYLDAGQKDELRRLYDIREHGGELEKVSARSGEQLRRLNGQFRAAKKRGFDRSVFERRHQLAALEARYLDMFETVFGSLAGAEAPQGDAAARIAVYTEEIRKLERRYGQLLRRRLLDRTLEQALRKSRPGMQVKRLGEAGTGAGNSRTLYQIGESGTALEVYQDARGQILIEAGGIVEDAAAVTGAQEETIEKNNHFFCDHQLPAILDAFSEELEAADLGSEVKLQREPDADSVHIFSLRDYPKAEAGALIIEKDGTLRRDTGAGQQQKKQLRLDEE